MKPIIIPRQVVRFIALTSALLLAATGCNRKNAGVQDISAGVTIEQSAMIPRQVETVRAITSAPSRPMTGSGLAGAQGGARVKVLKPGKHEVIISMPQLADTQIPVCYSIATTPRRPGRSTVFAEGEIRIWLSACN